MAVAFVAIPYCMTAVIQRRDNLDLMKRQTSAVEKLLKQEGDRQSGEA